MRRVGQVERLGPLIVLSAAYLFSTAAFGQTAIWTGTSSNDWNTASNWSTGAVPTTGTAIFDASGQTSIVFQLSINGSQTPPNIITPPATIQSLQFNSGAPSYTFTLSAPYRPYDVLSLTG